MMRFGTAISFSWCLAVLALLLVDAAPAVACTPLPGGRVYNPDTVTWVVEGWVERIVVRNDVVSGSAAFTPVDVVIRTEVAHKGQVPSTFFFREDTSYHAVRDRHGNVQSQWDGPSNGSCGMFGADPTGQYALIAAQTSRVKPDRVRLAVFGKGPNDSAVAALRQQIQSAPPPSEPPQIVPATSANLPEGSPGFRADKSGLKEGPQIPFTTLFAVLLVGGSVVYLLATGRAQRWIRHGR